MRISSKIALFYTVVTMTLIAVVILVLYFFTSQYINKLYDSYLIEKAYLTAQKHLEKDEVDESSYREIQKKYNELLPQSQEKLFNIDSVRCINDSLNLYLTLDQQTRLFDNHPVSFKYGNFRGAALYYPDNEGNFVILVMARNHYGQDIQQHVLFLVILLFIISCSFIYLIGRIYANRILLPLQHTLHELHRIRGNNLSVRMKTTNNKDELDELIRALNDMLDRVDAAFQTEKSFISNASHELNNPLTAIQGECEITLLKERSTTEYMASLQRISEESKRMTVLIKHLLFLSLQDKDILQNVTEEIDLVVFLKKLCSQYPRVKFDRVENNKTIYIRANSNLLNIALQNLLNNAQKYSEELVEVRLKVIEDVTVLEIKDYGIGIPENELQHIFHSFYRACNVRGYTGQGIGLSLSMKILSVYGGSIYVESKENEYTTVTVTFPCCPDAGRQDTVI